MDHLDLDVREGEVFAFLGPNGAGKTTTVRMLACLVAPTEGQAWVNGRQVGVDNDQIRGEVGILTESPGLYEKLSAYQNLDIYGRLYGVPDAAAPGADRGAADPPGPVGPPRRRVRQLLQGHEAEAGHRPRPAPRAQGALPGRAHLGPGPGGGQGGARLHQRAAQGGPHGLSVHPQPGRGRPPGRPHRHHAPPAAAGGHAGQPAPVALRQAGVRAAQAFGPGLPAAGEGPGLRQGSLGHETAACW